MNFELHTPESAPDAVKPDLEAAQKAYGTVPNLYRGMAGSPAALKSYLFISEALTNHGRLSPVEQQVVYLTVSAENGCTYCVGAHSTLAEMVGMPEPVLARLRDQRAPDDARLAALRKFTLSVMAHRGWVPPQDLDAFQSAGYDQAHVLEVLTILAQKTLSNYYNHLAQTPLDSLFEKHAWRPAGQPAT
jgi:uncharacterized peroxidase-related enzyme